MRYEGKPSEAKLSPGIAGIVRPPSLTGCSLGGMAELIFRTRALLRPLHICLWQAGRSVHRKGQDDG
jgi:hypothetical protein